MANHIIGLVNSARDEWEASERTGLPVTTNDSDTQELVTSLYTGKAFKPVTAPRQSTPQGSSASTLPGTISHNFDIYTKDIMLMFQ